MKRATMCYWCGFFPGTIAATGSPNAACFHCYLTRGAPPRDVKKFTLAEMIDAHSEVQRAQQDPARRLEWGRYQAGVLCLAFEDGSSTVLGTFCAE